jgi:Heterokaryon incompatibility protein Het-C/Domain of unknown function (DUF4157)
MAPSAIPAGMSNAAIARAAAAGIGAPLPSNAHGALRALGAQAGGVRLHTGAAADAKLAGRPDALAATEGTDIFLGRSAPALDTPGGELLLAHEAAHVRQQTTAGPAVSREAAELQADQAAVAATLGAPVPALSAARGPLYFEAKWHQASLTGAMKSMGFTDAEQQAAYFGNWCRDLSQALVPMAASTIGTQAAFQLVNLLAMHKFGHGVTPAQLGTYDPRQHIDNPAGTTDRDVLPSGVEIKGYGDEGQAAGPQDASALEPGNIAKSFEVSAAGVPAYMESSRQLAEQEALIAIEKGRTPEGMMHVGTFSHIIEDLFAHSNWIEIAVGDVVSKNPDLIPKGETHDDVAARLKENRPPIETYAADVAVAGKGARPILATGTFSGGGSGNDTMISVKAELQNILRDREPFKEDGGGGEMYDFAIEVLKRAEASADEGSLGDIFTTVVEQAAGNLGGMALGKLDALPGQARKTLGDGVLGDIATGAAELLSEGADAAGDLAGDAWKAGLKEVIKDAANQLGGAISLAEIAVYLKGGANDIARAWKTLKDGVRALPDAIKEILLPELVAAERNFKKQLRDLANAAYGRAVEILIDEVEGLSPAVDTAETNVGVKEEDLKKRLDETKHKMIAALNEVGGEEGAKVATKLGEMDHEQIAAFASSDAFHKILAGLAADAGARARLQGIADDMGDKQHTLDQLANVPPWAKAGASHSQIAKDHDDGAFFGVAFACAQKADKTLISALQAAWMDAGYLGPGAGMEANFTDAKGNLIPTGNEAEDARRKKFLETRGDGDYTIEHGSGPNKDVGPRLVQLGNAVDTLIGAHPILGPILSGLSWALGHSTDVQEAKAELQRTRTQWETAAKSGTYDDAIMDAVDKAIGTVARGLDVLGTDRDGHDHDFDSHHPKQTHDDKKTPDEDEAHEHGGRDEVAYQSQLKTLQANRGEHGVKPTADVGADRTTPAAAPIVEKIREIFNHPYESSWWREDVEKWCRANGPTLERSIKDRNAGVMHSHAH